MAAQELRVEVAEVIVVEGDQRSSLAVPTTSTRRFRLDVALPSPESGRGHNAVVAPSSPTRFLGPGGVSTLGDAFHPGSVGPLVRTAPLRPMTGRRMIRVINGRWVRYGSLAGA